MTPIIFDGILGKIDNPPEGIPPSGLGVVIVPPHGIEALASTKSLRLLAETLNRVGHATLRYDLPGTGDSLGSDLDPGRVAAWLASIPQAASQLQQATGVSGIVVAGLRFGALLAASAASEVADLAGLVLIDPITRGRIYTRELAMTARAVAEGARLDPDATSTEAGLLIGGLLTTRETLDDLKALDLSKLTIPAPALILHRPGAQDAASLAATGIDAEPVDGLDAIGLSPTMAVTPHAAFGRATTWLARLPSRPLRPAAAPAPAVLEGTGFVEEPITFGPAGQLFGVLCRPSSLATGEVLLILNAGRNPHIGWARSTVAMARRLAAEGTASFRFDLRGIGDSPDRPGAEDDLEDLLYVPDHAGEVAAAIDAMAERGFGQPAILGACSGAYLAFRTAANDPRIAGLVIVNIQRFVWRSGETVAEAIASSYAAASSYVAKVWEPRAWLRLFTGQRNPLPIAAEFARRAWARLGRIRPSAETREARALMAKVVARGIPVDMVFSEDDAGLSELARHFGARGRALGGARAVRLHFIPNADHDLTPAEAREALFSVTSEAAQQLKAIGDGGTNPPRHGIRIGEA
ncbi:alpha/beta fold hydrolase [Phreatobacter aquaticus]|uniref:Alpha/beta fold hydrolase n=1 Tax=Phreatobacter aquaticus TaxID=2570229 RepID=A0A4D7QSN7_9HYPH|nr:alpha/beta fold hydrolase [Phreatobacter aquaticus]QCK88526.1 alpha/beta fold hydrolase [Phreatobacter aquaticus]